MDTIQPSLLPLPPSGGKTAGAARPVGNRDRLTDFHEELRREVARGHVDETSRNPISTRATNGGGKTIDNEGKSSDGDNKPRENSEISKPAASGDQENVTEEDSVSADELAPSDSSADAEVSDEEQATAEDTLPAVPSELQAPLAPATEEPLVDPSDGAAPLQGKGLAEDKAHPGADIQSGKEGSQSGVLAGDIASAMTEAGSQAALSHLSRSSKMLDAASGEGDVLPTVGNGAVLAQVEATAGHTLETSGGGLPDDPLNTQSPLTTDLAEQSSDPNQTAASDLPTLDAKGELGHGSQRELTSGDNRTSHVATPSWATSEASHSAGRSRVAASEAPQVDPARFVSRVTRAFEVANLRGGAVTLRLSPPELGAMRVEVSVQQGVLSAHLETETAAAKSILIDNLPALRERLAALDIRVERFDVDVRQESTGGQPDWQDPQESRNHRQARSGPTARGDRGSINPEVLGEAARPHSPLDSQGHLNTLA